MNTKLEYVLFFTFVLILTFVTLKWVLPNIRAMVDTEESEYMQATKAIEALKSEYDSLVRYVLPPVDMSDLNKEHELALEQLKRKGVKQLEATYSAAEMDAKAHLVKKITEEILIDLEKSDTLEKCVQVFKDDLTNKEKDSI